MTATWNAPRKTILRSLAGFGSASTNGDYLTGFRASSHRSGTTPAHDWRNYPGHVPAFVDRMRGVFIENKEACEVITAHDSRETLIYVDPPYPHSTRNMKRGNAAYAHEMTDLDHERLAEQLHEVAGMVLVSGYGCPLYDRLFAGWMRVEQEAHADGARDRIEVMWLNDACASVQRQQRLIA
jgi:DNA adenine methylase